jgi:hypothetical protein
MLTEHMVKSAALLADKNVTTVEILREADMSNSKVLLEWGMHRFDSDAVLLVLSGDLL